jgi:hypothetical protein
MHPRPGGGYGVLPYQKIFTPNSGPARGADAGKFFIVPKFKRSKIKARDFPAWQGTP